MNEESEVTTDGIQTGGNQPAIPVPGRRWRMKQPTKDELREQLRIANELTESLAIEVQRLHRLTKRLRDRMHAAAAIVGVLGVCVGALLSLLPG